MPGDFMFRQDLKILCTWVFGCPEQTKGPLRCLVQGVRLGAEWGDIGDIAWRHGYKPRRVGLHVRRQVVARVARRCRLCSCRL